jgi:hypothetical protein
MVMETASKIELKLKKQVELTNLRYRVFLADDVEGQATAKVTEFLPGDIDHVNIAIQQTMFTMVSKLELPEQVLTLA